MVNKTVRICILQVREIQSKISEILKNIISTKHKIALISPTRKVMLKIIQARLQQYMGCELPDIQARFRKGRGSRDQIAIIHWIMEKSRDFQKNIYFCLLTMPKPLTGGSQ